MQNQLVGCIVWNKPDDSVTLPLLTEKLRPWLTVIIV